MPRSAITCAVCQRSRTRGSHNHAGDVFICAECGADAKQFIGIQDSIWAEAGEASQSTDETEVLTRLHLEVYDTKTGLWHPELSELTQPDGWDFLPAGDAFVTRRVKAAGVYWVLFRPKGRREHRRQLGLLAPAATIASAQAAADATAARREIERVASTHRRDKNEAAYRTEFEDAVIQWLRFSPAHAALASDIAHGAADRAAVVGSGRVGRTKTLSLEDRAALAARAFIRHRYTDYEDQLFAVELIESDHDIDADIVEVGDYREIKQAAHREVDAFLEEHRRP